MGANTRGFANLLNTDGTFLSGAINNTSISGITDLPTAAKSDLVPIIGYGLGNDAAMEHVDGNRSGVAVFDGTYDAYCFIFTNIHGTATAQLRFNASTDSGSNYNVTKTTTYFVARHDENGSNGQIGYDTGNDLAQGTGDQLLCDNFGADNDASLSGTLWIFNPSSTTYVKHFYSDCQYYQSAVPRTNRTFVGGYLNTTSAVNAIIFRMSTGNLESGSVRVYGLK